MSKRDTTKAGFSLVEMLMTLSLLTVVSLPMVMMIHQQKQEAEASKAKSQSVLAIGRLFDTVNVSNFNYGAYTQLESAKTSVLCDPYLPAHKTDATYCANTLPLFDRSVTYNQSDNTLDVTVNLYYSTSGGADYTLSRKYSPYQHYRIMTAPTATNANKFKVRIDSEGNAWSVEALSTATTFRNFLPQQTKTNCTSTTVTAGEPYFENYRPIGTSGCASEYYFNVVPQKRYAVKVYYTAVATTAQPKIDICSSKMSALSTYHTCSYDVANFNPADSQPLATPLYSDQYAIGTESTTSPNIRQYVVPLETDQNVLHLSVAGTSTTLANVSAIEVIQL